MVEECCTFHILAQRSCIIEQLLLSAPGQRFHMLYKYTPTETKDEHIKANRPPIYIIVESLEFAVVFQRTLIIYDGLLA